MKKSRFLRPAKLEMLDAAEFYDLRRLGLGREFLECVETAIQGLLEHPESGPIVRGNVRRRLTRRFPYAILYRVDPDEIVIIAIMHHRRRPNYWVDRIG